MTNANERRHYFPQDTWESLKFYAADERLKLSEEIRDSLTPQELGWAIINNHLQMMGHYPPKNKARPQAKEDPGEI